MGYHGERAIVLSSLLDHHENSLVRQSLRARKTRTGINADGFGIGWYDRSIDGFPGLFRSILPAWNEHNLHSLASKIRSNCFMGHVRASTVGNVGLDNCHPFVFGKLLCAHNGTIKEFNRIKRYAFDEIDDLNFGRIRGQTDSEHLFAIVATLLGERERYQAEEMRDALLEAMGKMHALQRKHAATDIIRANILMTDGRELVAMRYSSDPSRPPISMYHSTVTFEREEPVFIGKEGGRGVVVASEYLTDDPDHWCEVPAGHALLSDEAHRVRIEPLSH